MTSIKKFHSANYCKLCFSEQLDLRIKLAPTPPAEWYFKPEDKRLNKFLVPLDLYQCSRCGHAQLVDVISPHTLYSNYFYTTESSPGLKNYFEKSVNNIIDFLQLDSEQTVLDIGSNDGTFLKFFMGKGYKVIGVEPSKKLSEGANAAGIDTLNCFFDKKCVQTVVSRYGKLSLVTANNVFAHNEHLAEILEGIEEILSDQGYFVFEVSYLYDTVINNVFDFIYHEHVSYHSVKPLVAFMRRAGLELFHVERTPSKGGTIRCYAAKKTNPLIKINSSINTLINLENSAGLYGKEVYFSMQKKIEKIGGEFREHLQSLKLKGLKIAGYGACATVTTLLHQFNIADSIDFLVDDNPIRHGTLSPGHHVPVFSPESIADENVDVIAILAWRFENKIMARNYKLFLNRQIVVPDLN
ncbi:class I SAM-dependent methyltransferase [Alphaproteobacteria bacterium]|nr:class I SAM-dependent methyltransferase [Alphaproteobacteria bacterium]